MIEGTYLNSSFPTKKATVVRRLRSFIAIWTLCVWCGHRRKFTPPTDNLACAHTVAIITQSKQEFDMKEQFLLNFEMS